MRMKRMMRVALLLMGLFCLGAAAAETELNIDGSFQLPRKPGLPPQKWNRLSGSNGSLEILQDEEGVSVMLSSEKKSRFGIYSAAVAAKAGDRIRIEAQVYADEISVSILQYAKGASSQTQKVKASREGKKISCEFMVADQEAKGPTQSIRVCFQVQNGQQATIANVKAFRLD